MKQKDRIASIAIIMIGAYVYFASTQMPLNAAKFPKTLAFTLIGLALILLVSTFNNLPSKEYNKDKPVNSNVGKFKTSYVILLIISIYIILFTVIGYMFSTLLMIISIMYALGERRKGQLIFIPLFSTLIIYYIFDSLLRVSLP